MAVPDRTDRHCGIRPQPVFQLRKGESAHTNGIGVAVSTLIPAKSILQMFRARHSCSEECDDDERDTGICGRISKGRIARACRGVHQWRHDRKTGRRTGRPDDPAQIGIVPIQQSRRVPVDIRVVGVRGELQDNLRTALPNREPPVFCGYILHGLGVRLGNSHGTPDTSDCRFAFSPIRAESPGARRTRPGSPAAGCEILAGASVPEDTPEGKEAGRSGCRDRVFLNLHQRINPRRPQESTRLQPSSPQPSRRRPCSRVLSQPAKGSLWSDCRPGGRTCTLPPG